MPRRRANPDERDVELYETILSGDLAGDDVGDLSDPSRDENSHTVVGVNGAVNTALLDGFTITGANHTGTGGGMYVAGNATISNCIITANTAGTGAGMYASGALDATQGIRGTQVRVQPSQILQTRQEPCRNND